VPMARSEPQGHLELASKPASVPVPVAGTRSPPVWSLAALLMIAGAGLGAIATMLVFILSMAWDPFRGAPAPRPAARFDAAAVPPVTDDARRSLAIYSARPDAKALAIAPDGIGLADGQPDIESAKQEALRQCAISAKRVCRIYAAGMDVVWSKGFLPVP